MLHVWVGPWWALLLRGLAAVTLCTFALAAPQAPVEELLSWFAVYALADGLFCVVALATTPERLAISWPLGLQTAASGAAGLAALGTAVPTADRLVVRS